MVTKLFVLGRPGSGKSVAARYLTRIAEAHKWATIRINDYRFLYDKFQKEMELPASERRQFCPTEHKGFEVIDFSVLDTALIEIRSKAEKAVASGKYRLVILEFARNDYSRAMRFFNSFFLRDAYFLLIGADLEACISRIYERTSHPHTPDDHFISENTLRGYYKNDNMRYIAAHMRTHYRVNAEHVMIIKNRGSLQHFVDLISEFAEANLGLKRVLLPDTEPWEAIRPSAIKQIQREQEQQ